MKIYFLKVLFVYVCKCLRIHASCMLHVRVPEESRKGGQVIRAAVKSEYELPNVSTARTASNLNHRYISPGPEISFEKDFDLSL